MARKPALPRDGTRLSVEKLGVHGDGIATLPDGKPVFIPFALPREEAEVSFVSPRGNGWLARIEQILTSSEARVIPPCPHYGRCGGCATQHWREDAARAWKADRILSALAFAGFTQLPTPEIVAASGDGAGQRRRRADLALRHVGGRISIGLHEIAGPGIVDLQDCLILDPGIVALLPLLRQLAKRPGLLRREGSAIVTRIDNGLDLLLRTDGALSLDARQAMVALAREQGIARISWGGPRGEPETVCMLSPPRLTLSGLTVTLPPGAFLQATEAGERAIITAILEGMPPPRSGRGLKIIELFAGCGSFTGTLAALGRVTAIEGNEAALAALRQAAGQLPVKTLCRDLARQPLRQADLEGIDAVVLDPPHGGAEHQMPAITGSGVGTVIYVSCNPMALGRDASPLRQAGYRLARLSVIDQFRWSPEVEAVAVFVKPRRNAS